MTWETKPLGELGTWTGGGTPSKARADFWDGSIPWLSPKDMGTPRLVGTKDHITEVALKESSTKLVPAGAVAVVTRSGILEHTLPSALVPFDVTLNQDMKAITPAEGVEVKWILWGLRAFERQILDTCRKAGTTVASIEWKRFAQFHLPIPTLAEQRRIVELVEEHLSHLDAADAILVKSQTMLEKLRVSTMSEALSKARRLGAKESSVGEESVLIEYGSSAKTGERGADDDVPVVRMGNIQRAELDWANLKYLPRTHPDVERYRLCPGDLLFNRTNSAELVGKSAVYDSGQPDALFASYLIRTRFRETVLSEWANLAINSSAGRAYIASVVSQQVGQANVNSKKLRAFPLPVPSLEQQHDLLARFQDTVEGLHRLEAQVTLAQTRSTGLRRAVLAAAFSGRLTGHASDADVIEKLARSTPAGDDLSSI